MIVVGVPTLNRYDLCEKLLTSVCAGTRLPNQIVVIDNGGKLTGYRNRAHTVPVEIVRPGKNLGVGPAWNTLARSYLKTAQDRLLICGDDTTLQPDVMEQVLLTMSNTGADFVFPDPARSTMPQMFTCFLVRKSLFDKVGYFDEKFWPAYFEDNDFHRRMKLAGAIESVAPCGYDHLNSGTMKSFTPEETERHHERFRACRDYYIEKWGGLPGAERFSDPFDGHGEGPLSF